METQAKFHHQFNFTKTFKCFIRSSLRKQPSFFAPGPSGVSREGPSRETPLGPGAKKDGCFRRLHTKFNISFRRLVLLEMNCFEKIFKRALQKFAIYYVNNLGSRFLSTCYSNF